MKYTIRQAYTADARAIASVQVESWKTTYAGIVPDAFLASMTVAEQTTLWQKPLAENSASFFVAEDELGVFGFAAGGSLREKFAGYDAELYAIYLLQSRQMQGAGRALVAAIGKRLRSQGFHGMLVWVLEQNSAVRFYRRLGAIEVTRKFIDIGGACLSDLAFGWPNLHIGAPDMESPL